MSSKEITYTDAPKDAAEAILAGEAVPDFLPPPEKLVRKDQKPTTGARKILLVPQPLSPCK